MRREAGWDAYVKNVISGSLDSRRLCCTQWREAWRSLDFEGNGMNCPARKCTSTSRTTAARGDGITRGRLPALRLTQSKKARNRRPRHVYAASRPRTWTLLTSHYDVRRREPTPYECFWLQCFRGRLIEDKYEKKIGVHAAPWSLI